MSTDAATQALTPRKSKKGKDAESYQERLYTASQWVLIWHRFRRHRLAMIGGVVLLIMYTLALLAPFASPYGPNKKFNDALNQRPTAVRFVDMDGNFSLRPFVYGVTRETDRRTLERIYTSRPDTEVLCEVLRSG
jgi:peptide/nickel transport system permease protein